MPSNNCYSQFVSFTTKRITSTNYISSDIYGSLVFTFSVYIGLVMCR